MKERAAQKKKAVNLRVGRQAGGAWFLVQPKINAKKGGEKWRKRHQGRRKKHTTNAAYIEVSLLVTVMKIEFSFIPVVGVNEIKWTRGGKQKKAKTGRTEKQAAPTEWLKTGKGKSKTKEKPVSDEASVAHPPPSRAGVNNSSWREGLLIFVPFVFFSVGGRLGFPRCYFSLSLWEVPEHFFFSFLFLFDLSGGLWWTVSQQDKQDRIYISSDTLMQQRSGNCCNLILPDFGAEMYHYTKMDTFKLETA